MTPHIQLWGALFCQDMSFIMPIAPIISATGIKSINPPATINPPIRVGRAIIIKIIAITFATPQVSLNISLIVQMNKLINNTVNKMSNIIFLLSITKIREY